MAKHLCIFASGTGSNAQKIIDYFRDNEAINIRLIVTNKASAGVLSIAKREKIPSHVLAKNELESEVFIGKLKQNDIDLIVLAGFLKLIPSSLIKAFPNQIINIHPALLPKYGGKGMFGKHVHKAVKENGETKSGMTIHYVNEQYDEGEHIFQASCDIFPEDMPEMIARKVLVLEHGFYGIVIERLLKA
jgi:phosphoribosylglycinamide formyltransferase-1